MHSLLDLPDDVILQVFQKLDAEVISTVCLACKPIKKFIEENRNHLKSRKILHIDLDRRRIRAWRDISWCDRIPFLSFDYISEFFRNIDLKVLTVNKLDEEICEFLILHAKNYRLRFEQIRLVHSFSASKKSISDLLLASKCRAINFEAVPSNLNISDLELSGFQELDTLSFEMDDTIGPDFFEKVLDASKATKFIFHGCDRISEAFIRKLFRKWKYDSRKLDAVRITTNQNISFDSIIENLGLQKLDHCTWTTENGNGDKAMITMRRNAFHFFVAFEVNNFHVENILYKIPMIE